MKKSGLACPYCNEKVGFVRAFQSKTNEEYFCPNCNNFSLVTLRPEIKNLAKILAILVGLVIVIFSLFFRFYIWATFLIVLLFFSFYLQVPRFIILKKKN